jgi:2-haloacid dehalogenase
VRRFIDSLKNTNQQKPIYGQQKLAVKPEEMLMIAAHGWDLAGASHAGLATCFIAREGQSLYIQHPILKLLILAIVGWI